MLRKLIVFVMVLCVAMPSVAQVEFSVDLVETYEEAVLDFHGLNSEFKNTAEYMFLTNQEADYCSGNLLFSDAKE